MTDAEEKLNDEKARDAMRRALTVMETLSARDLRESERAMLKAAYKTDGHPPNGYGVALTIALTNMGFMSIKLPDGRNALVRKPGNQYAKG